MRLNRERVPRYLREGRGQVEQISRGVISVEHAWKNNKRDTRSVRSYYEGMKEAQEAAGCRSRGLSNMSNVVLGDDRIHWDKSFSQEAYKLDASRAQLVNAARRNHRRSVNGTWTTRTRMRLWACLSSTRWSS